MYFSRAILDWVASVHAPHDPALEHAFQVPATAGLPPIQVGPSEGRLLELLLRLAGARKVVEVGTLAGYSALRMARSLPPDGHLWTIELEPGHAARAREAIARAAPPVPVEVLEGAALDVLPTLEREGPFDAVFIDADKEHYDAYGRWAARHLRPGGLLLADNAFVFGELLDDTPRGQAMRRFHLEAREAFHTVCIPTPDGLLLGLRRPLAARAI